MNSLAISNAEMGRLEEAERLFTEVLDIRRPLLGPDHNENLVTTGNLANVYMMQERYDEAETLLARNMETQRHLLGERHPDTLRSTFNLACLAALQGQRDRALRFLRLCLDRGLAHKVIFDNPVLQSLHGDPEFEAIVAEVRRRIDEAEAD
jgi:tetratricopeptide (TPR) repeat protein